MKKSWLRSIWTLCNAWRLSVSLSVCLLTTLRKNYWTDLRENFITDVGLPVDKTELITFWKSPASESGSRNFLKDSSTLWEMAFFHNLAYIISGESDRIFMKILLQMNPWTKKSLLNFGSNPNPDSVSGDGLRIQTIFSLADVCGLWLSCIWTEWQQMLARYSVYNIRQREAVFVSIVQLASTCL